MPSTAGYLEKASRFIKLSESLGFDLVNKDFLPYLPPPPSRILDVGSGAGQNAAALADLGHHVTAVEPLREFLALAKKRYHHKSILWIEDWLPRLNTFATIHGSFDFILADAVWHHLDENERLGSLKTVSSLLAMGGKCAISLRNGPRGLGSRVFPTSIKQTICDANRFGLKCLFSLENQPSLLKHKSGVHWCRVLFQKN